MDAHFFRFAVQELYEILRGLRIKKVYMPAQGVWTFSFGSDLNLIFRASRKNGCFFLSRDKPFNPPQPTSQAMWLRKRIKNQRIIGFVNSWPWRKAAFELSFSRDYLILDIARGVFLESQAPENESSLHWPQMSEISGGKEIWKTYPQMTPSLRDALSRRRAGDAEKLLADLKEGVPHGFYIYRDAKGRKRPGCFLPDDSFRYKSFEYALEAARAYGQNEIGRITAQVSDKERAASAEVQRLHKNLSKVLKDRERLEMMVRESELGHLLKAHLYSLDSRAKLAEIRLKDSADVEHVVKLDPAKTVNENMEWFFRRAAKGRRGLDFVSKRQKELEKRIDNAPVSLELKESSEFRSSLPGAKSSQKQKKIAAKIFQSSEGFVILRAKNRQAGHELLKSRAAHHDLWFHVEGGPGAHVILKREHEHVHVPEQSMLEAANLAALASYRKNDKKAAVHCAMVKDVRRIKGAPAGKVTVSNVIKLIIVNIDPDQEDVLAI